MPDEERGRSVGADLIEGTTSVIGELLQAFLIVVGVFILGLVLTVADLSVGPLIMLVGTPLAIVGVVVWLIARHVRRWARIGKAVQVGLRQRASERDAARSSDANDLHASSGGPTHSIDPPQPEA